MGLSSGQRLAYAWFGGIASRAAKRNPHLQVSLQRANILVRPDVYLSMAILLAMGAGVLAALPLLTVVLAGATGTIDLPPRLLLLLVPAPLVVPGLVYLMAVLTPDLRAVGRARDIDAKLPYALNYVSTMASAGATPETIFSNLARQPVYGAVAHEAAAITRDLRVLGSDIVRALSSAVERSPSTRFQDLMQGAITSLTSGGDLKTYFSQKADQFMYENRADQKKFLDSLAVLAESFVTVVVAAPLFLIVILSVMSSFGGSATEVLLLGYSLVFLLIPLSQLGFAWTIKVMTPEA